MKSIIVFTVFFISITLACKNGKKQEVKPETVHPVTYIYKSNDWYLQQAKLWKELVNQNPKNIEAWYNYYKANRYANLSDIRSKDEQRLLNQIIKEMGDNNPDSYEYLYLKGRHTSNDQESLRMSFMKKAYSLDSNRTETYHAFIDYYDMQENDKKEQEFYEKLYNSKDIAPGLLNYNFNVLMSTEKNGILFTNGDNDTYPAQMLQKVLNIRKDVTIVNISMLKGLKGYLENRLGEKNITINLKTFPPKYDDNFLDDLCNNLANNYPKIPIYFALTVYKSFTEKFDKNLYVVGLASKYCQKRIDNIKLAKENIENNFRMDYLRHDWYSESFLANSLMPNLNMNYTVSLAMLIEFYKSIENHDEMEKWKKITLHIAKNADKEDQIKKYLIDKGL